jgi:hypothetical protein
MHGIVHDQPHESRSAECFAGLRVYHNLPSPPEPFWPQRLLAQRLMKKREKPNNFAPRRASSAATWKSKRGKDFRRPPHRLSAPPLKEPPQRKIGEFRLCGTNRAGATPALIYASSSASPT